MRSLSSKWASLIQFTATHSLMTTRLWKVASQLSFRHCLMSSRIGGSRKSAWNHMFLALCQAKSSAWYARTTWNGRKWAYQLGNKQKKCSNSSLLRCQHWIRQDNRQPETQTEWQYRLAVSLQFLGNRADIDCWVQKIWVLLLLKRWSKKWSIYWWQKIIPHLSLSISYDSWEEKWIIEPL